MYARDQSRRLGGRDYPLGWLVLLIAETLIKSKIHTQSLLYITSLSNGSCWLGVAYVTMLKFKAINEYFI